MRAAIPSRLTNSRNALTLKRISSRRNFKKGSPECFPVVIRSISSIQPAFLHPEAHPVSLPHFIGGEKKKRKTSILRDLLLSTATMQVSSATTKRWSFMPHFPRFHRVLGSSSTEGGGVGKRGG
jgi:hypothetical protein